MLIGSKRYYSLADAAERCKCSTTDLVHLGARGELPIYALADGWRVEVWGKEAVLMDPDGCEIVGPPDPRLGATETVCAIGPEFKASLVETVVGPVRLHPATLAKYEANPAIKEYRFVGPMNSNAPELEYEYRLAGVLEGYPQNGIAIGNCVLLVTVDDALAFVNQDGPADAELSDVEESIREYDVPKRKAPDKFVAALIRLLTEVAKRAARGRQEFEVFAMPGRKKDFLAVAEKFDDALEVSYATFDTYLSGLCQFRQGAPETDFYAKLFPEYFR